MEWRTIADAASMWVPGVGRKTLYRAIREGKLEAARIGAGRNLLVSQDQINAWLTSISTRERREPRKRQPRKAALQLAG